MKVGHLPFLGIKLKINANTLLFIGAAFLLPQSVFAVDSASLEFATGNKTQVLRVGAQWNWESQWLKLDGMHIGGYWDASLAQWRGTNHQQTGGTQNLTDIGFTPVLRLQNDNKKGFYSEMGIGAHLLSGTYDNNGRHFSTNFQFGDHIGIGYVMSNGLDVSLKIQHFSNGGVKHPNSGVEFGVLKVGYAF